MRANEKIRETIKRNNVFQWEVAEAIGISEVTLIRWLRTPLNEEQETRVNEGIKKATLKKGVTK